MKRIIDIDLDTRCKRLETGLRRFLNKYSDVIENCKLMDIKATLEELVCNAENEGFGEYVDSCEDCVNPYTIVLSYDDYYVYISVIVYGEDETQLNATKNRNSKRLTQKTMAILNEVKNNAWGSTRTIAALLYYRVVHLYQQDDEYFGDSSSNMFKTIKKYVKDVDIDPIIEIKGIDYSFEQFIPEAIAYCKIKGIEEEHGYVNFNAFAKQLYLDYINMNFVESYVEDLRIAEEAAALLNGMDYVDTDSIVERKDENMMFTKSMIGTPIIFRSAEDKEFSDIKQLSDVYKIECVYGVDCGNYTIIVDILKDTIQIKHEFPITVNNTMLDEYLSFITFSILNENLEFKGRILVYEYEYEDEVKISISSEKHVYDLDFNSIKTGYRQYIRSVYPEFQELRDRYQFDFEFDPVVKYNHVDSGVWYEESLLNSQLGMYMSKPYDCCTRFLLGNYYNCDRIYYTLYSMPFTEIQLVVDGDTLKLPQKLVMGITMEYYLEYKGDPVSSICGDEDVQDIMLGCHKLYKEVRR